MGWKAIDLARSKGALPGSPLFSMMKDLKETSKAGNIKGILGHRGDGSQRSQEWCHVLCASRSPHSRARLLGEMEALIYAEEALQEKAVLVPNQHLRSDAQAVDDVKAAPLVDQTQTGAVAPSTPVFTAMPIHPQEERASLGLFHALQPPRDLWVVGWSPRAEV